MPPIKNPHLQLVSIRLDKRDLKVARKVGNRREIPYQHVVRGWVTDGATLTKAQDKAPKASKTMKAAKGKRTKTKAKTKARAKRRG